MYHLHRPHLRRNLKKKKMASSQSKSRQLLSLPHHLSRPSLNPRFKHLLELHQPQLSLSQRKKNHNSEDPLRSPQTLQKWEQSQSAPLNQNPHQNQNLLESQSLNQSLKSLRDPTKLSVREPTKSNKKSRRRKKRKL
jgi:hypothetical protein